MRIAIHYTVAVLLMMRAAPVVATTDAVGFRDAFRCGASVYSFGSSDAGELELSVWNASAKTFAPVPLVKSAPVPAAIAEVQTADCSFAFAVPRANDHASIERLSINGSGEGVIESGPAFPFRDDGIGLHRMRDGSFVLVGKTHAVIVGSGGRSCAVVFDPFLVGASASAVASDTLVVGPHVQTVALRCNDATVRRPFALPVLQIVGRPGSWLVTLQRGMYRREALLALDAHFRPRWLARLAGIAWRLDELPAGIIAWYPTSDAAFLVRPNDTVVELRLAPHRGGVDLIKCSTCSDITFLADDGPVATRVIGSVATHRLVTVGYLWFGADQLLIAAAIALLLIAAAVALRVAARRR